MWNIGGRGQDSCGSGFGLVAGFCKHGNEHFGSLYDGTIFEQLGGIWLLKKDSDSWSWLTRLLCDLNYGGSVRCADWGQGLMPNLILAVCPMAGKR
jgi:hypothetical protein